MYGIIIYPNCQSNPEKKGSDGGITFPDFRVYILQSYNYQNSMVLAKKGDTDHRNKIGRPGISPHGYGQVVYDKKGKYI